MQVTTLLLLAIASAAPQDELKTAPPVSAPAATPAAPEWTIFDHDVVAGKVPQLVPPPANLPVPKVTPEGVLLPRPLDSYVGAQLVGLRLYPALAQLALDNAVETERKAGNQRVADVLAAQPTTGDVLRDRLLWGAGGFALGVIIAGVAVAYLR